MANYSGVEYGAYHLQANPTLYSPQLAHNFMFIFPKFEKLLKPGHSEEEGDSAYMYNVGETLKVSCKSSDVPHYSRDSVEIKRGNSVAKFAGTAKFDDISLEFNSFIGADTKDALMAWQALCGSIENDTVYSLDNVDYKQVCYLVEYTSEYRQIGKWRLDGCWIKSLSEDGFSYDDQNKAKVLKATLSIDKAVRDDS